MGFFIMFLEIYRTEFFQISRDVAYLAISTKQQIVSFSEDIFDNFLCARLNIFLLCYFPFP